MSDLGTPPDHIRDMFREYLITDGGTSRGSEVQMDQKSL